MNCAEAAECVSALFDGQPISREVAAHLGDCHECRVRLNEYAEMGAELRDMSSAAAPQAIPEGRWRLAEPAAANNWLRKWRGTMRIPRFAFALMVVAIFALSGGLALVKARPGTNGPKLLLTIKSSLRAVGVLGHCAFDTNSSEGQHQCSFNTNTGGVPGQVWFSARYVRREGDRIQLAIKTKYSSELTSQGQLSDVLASVPEEKYWLHLEKVLEVPVVGLGAMEVSGQFVDYVPIVLHRPNEPYDPLPEEFRLWNPVVLRENRVLLNMAPLKTTDTGNDAAAMLYSPGVGRFIFSSVPIPGGVEGKLEVNQISFMLDGKDYLLVAGAPISRSDRIWVLYQPNWRVPSSESSPSGDHAMLGANNLQHLLEMK
ncbi:MAG TPA: hypothetical protein VGR55_01210 [Candidatus Acidoferrum sp.]|nr:hypothetical protein [Candidatus Acidoferrum sp.]